MLHHQQSNPRVCLFFDSYSCCFGQIISWQGSVAFFVGFLSSSGCNILHAVQRPKTYYLIVRRLRTLVRIVTKGALAFYRLNRKIKGTVMSEQDFFKHKNLHIGFRDWWASYPVARNNDNAVLRTTHLVNLQHQVFAVE